MGGPRLPRTLHAPGAVHGEDDGEAIDLVAQLHAAEGEGRRDDGEEHGGLDGATAPAGVARREPF